MAKDKKTPKAKGPKSETDKPKPRRKTARVVVTSAAAASSAGSTAAKARPASASGSASAKVPKKRSKAPVQAKSPSPPVEVLVKQPSKATGAVKDTSNLPGRLSDDDIRAVQAEIVEGESGFDPAYSGALEDESTFVDPLQVDEAARLENIDAEIETGDIENADAGLVEDLSAESEDLSHDEDGDHDGDHDRVSQRRRHPPALRPQGNRSLAPSDPVALYLAEIRRYPLLTREQEQELATRYRETGDPKAAEMLVTSNLRFVVKIAAEYSKFGAKLIDLIQEGNVGLMHAVKEFNPYKGVRLITYAVWWIRGYIQEYLMRQYSMVRIGTTQNQRKLFYRLQKERELLDQMGQEPNYKLLAGRLGVSEEDVETMSKRLKGRDVSLNQPFDSASGASLLDFETTEEPAVDEQLGHMEEIEVLRRNLEKIRPQLGEKEVFLLETRVLADEPLTLQEVGDKWGVTREAVRQMEARLIAKIRDAVTSSLNQGIDRDGHDDEDDAD
jgi:RNA polymerase sigma-32 factor